MPDSITVAGAIVGFSHLGSKLVERMLGPAADEIGAELKERVAAYRDRNRAAAVNRAAEMVGASGKTARPVPLRNALPALEGAAREDDPELQERWAALLANMATATDEESIPPVYASILSQLTPRAAALLEILRVTKPLRGEARDGALTEAGGISPEILALEMTPTWQALTTDDRNAARSKVRALVDLLVREGLATSSPVLKYDEPPGLVQALLYAGGDGHQPNPRVELGGMEVRITELGRRFLDACTAPLPQGRATS